MRYPVKILELLLSGSKFRISTFNVKMAKSRYPKLNWEYDFADTIRVICGLVPKKQPKVPDFNPWDWKSYKVENCSQDLINYQKLLAEKGLKDPWIRCVVVDSDYSTYILYHPGEKDMHSLT